MKKVLLAFAGFFIVFAAVYFTQRIFNGEFRLSFANNNPTITISKQTFDLKVAKSQQEREIGLSETKSLPQNQGMIFIFEKPDFYSFWMKNMKFPIDIIYINNDTIVTIIKSAPAPKDNGNPTIYNSTQPADKVLEINAGLSDKYQFKDGDKVVISGL